MPNVTASVFNLNGVGRYVQWHWIQISVANLVVIGVMVALFVLAVLLPFPHGLERTEQQSPTSAPSVASADEEAR